MRLKRNVFSSDLKAVNDLQAPMCSGIELQSAGAVCENALSPLVFRLHLGTLE